jgi:predicted DNA repair protein MutK
MADRAAPDAGGRYLCFEGAEKVAIGCHPPTTTWRRRPAKKIAGEDSAHLEEQKVKGAIKTDFILSAEIMTIALAAIETESILDRGGRAGHRGDRDHRPRLRIGGADREGRRFRPAPRLPGPARRGRALGRGIVRGMPAFLRTLTIVGTMAMLWVGGSIITHALAGMGWHVPEDVVHDIAHMLAPLGVSPSGWPALCPARGSGDLRSGWC